MPRKELVITGSILVLMTYTLTLILVMQVFPAGQTSVTLTSSGSIQTTEGIGVYSNSYCTIPKTSIAWGELEKGGSCNVDMYIKNEGDSPITLSLMVSNWSPSNAADYLSINWDYDNHELNPGDIVHVTMTLSVDPNTQGINNFDVNVYIVGNL